MYNPCAVWY